MLFGCKPGKIKEMAKEEEEKKTQVSSQKAQAVSESHELDISTTVPLAWLWKNISGETKRPFFKVGSRVTSQMHILLLSIANLQPTHEFLQPLHPYGPSDLQHGHVSERVPVALPLGLWVFLMHSLRCPWGMNTHCWSQLHMCLAIADFKDSSAYLPYQKPSPS